MWAVIQAGGKGTRLSSITNGLIPKPMVRIAGKPLIQRQIEMLRKNGICDILIVVGHLGHVIQNYLKNGEQLGVGIQYIEEKEPLGTAGALYGIHRFLKQGDDFLLVYGDILFDVDIRKMIMFHKEKNSVGTLFVHPNDHPSESDLVIMDKNHKITGFDLKKSRDYWYDNCVNGGLFILNANLFQETGHSIKADLEKDVLFNLVKQNAEIFGYRSMEYLQDIGSEERLRKAEKQLNNGSILGRNRDNPQKCICLDRNILIQHGPAANQPEQLILCKDVSQAVRWINESSYLAFVVTSQLMEGNTTKEENDINRKLGSLLGNENAYFDNIGMDPYPLLSNEYSIDFQKSWIITGTYNNIWAGANKGMKTAVVSPVPQYFDEKRLIKPDISLSDLIKAVKIILSEDYNGISK